MLSNIWIASLLLLANSCDVSYQQQGKLLGCGLRSRNIVDLFFVHFVIPDLVTYTEFVNAVTATNHDAPPQDVFNAFLSGLPNGLISTKQEAAMALTHYIHESDGLKAKREYRCLEDGCPTEYQDPTCDIEGQDYFGRGYIQLTWCFNYKPASYDLFGDDRLVRDPDQVARDEQTAWNAAFWYWKTNVHDKEGVQEGQFGATTK